MQAAEDNRPYEATAFKVSTMTATGNMNTDIDLHVLFDFIPIVDEDITTGPAGIYYIEYGSTKETIRSKGKSKKKREGGKTGKQFVNQATCLLKPFTDRSFILNTKVFKNGRIQMTGIKREADGFDGMVALGGMLLEMHARAAVEGVTLLAAPGELRACDYEIRLINCDFRVNYEVVREKLLEILVGYYGMVCHFEPCIYQGVSIKYFWNTMNERQTGRCSCQPRCGGKDTGTGEGHCKKITMAVFQSGSVIITGATQMAQIHDAYAYIRGVLETHRDEIKKIRWLKPAEIAELKRRQEAASETKADEAATASETKVDDAVASETKVDDAVVSETHVDDTVASETHVDDAATAAE